MQISRRAFHADTPTWQGRVGRLQQSIYGPQPLRPAASLYGCRLPSSMRAQLRAVDSLHNAVHRPCLTRESMPVGGSSALLELPAAAAIWRLHWSGRLGGRA